MTATEERIAEWVAVCTQNATQNQSAAQNFERSIRDMAHAGFALPRAVVAGVRAALSPDGEG